MKETGYEILTELINRCIAAHTEKERIDILEAITFFLKAVELFEDYRK